MEKNRYILHFEGSDFITKVWVNGAYAGSRRGGYARISFDITELVCDGENQLTVKVEDSYDPQQPRGKQRWGREKLWMLVCDRLPVSGKRSGASMCQTSVWHL